MEGKGKNEGLKIIRDQGERERGATRTKRSIYSCSEMRQPDGDEGTIDDRQPWSHHRRIPGRLPSKRVGVFPQGETGLLFEISFCIYKKNQALSPLSPLSLPLRLCPCR